MVVLAVLVMTIGVLVMRVVVLEGLGREVVGPEEDWHGMGRLELGNRIRISVMM